MLPNKTRKRSTPSTPVEPEVNPVSNNANLSALTVSNSIYADLLPELSPEFDSNVKYYTLAVENEVEGVTLTPTAEHDNAAIQVNGEAVANGTQSQEIEIVVGDGNEIVIDVTAEDGITTNQYVISVIRQASDNANLEDIIPEYGSLEPLFHPDETNYSFIAHPDISLSFAFTAEDDAAVITIEITNTYNGIRFLYEELGSSGTTTPKNYNGVYEAIITVTAQDGTVKVYTLRIQHS